MQTCMGDVTWVVVGGTISAALDERVTVPARAVAHEDATGRELEDGGIDRSRSGHEDLAAAGVDHGEHTGAAGRERVERRDACRADLERQGETARDGEPDPGAREAPGPGADDDALEVGRESRRPRRSSASTSSSSVDARETLSPRTSSPSTSALVATSVAVSNARISTVHPF